MLSWIIAANKSSMKHSKHMEYNEHQYLKWSRSFQTAILPCWNTIWCHSNTRTDINVTQHLFVVVMLT